MGVPIIWIIIFLGLYWDPLILGNYHMDHSLNSYKRGYTGDYREDYYTGYTPWFSFFPCLLSLRGPSPAPAEG